MPSKVLIFGYGGSHKKIDEFSSRIQRDKGITYSYYSCNFLCRVIFCPKFELIEQLDEISLGAGHCDAVLLGLGLELFDREGAQVGDVAAFEGAFELGVSLAWASKSWSSFSRLGRFSSPSLISLYAPILSSHYPAMVTTQNEDRSKPIFRALVFHPLLGAAASGRSVAPASAGSQGLDVCRRLHLKTRIFIR